MPIKFPSGGGGTLSSLHRAQADRSKHMQKIASGLRILGAADDAAGLSISSEMGSELRSLSRAMQNSNDGVSMIQTADGAMGEIGKMLGRMRELSVQAGNGILNDTQRSQLDQEFQSLKSEIDRVSSTTDFNKAITRATRGK